MDDLAFVGTAPRSSSGTTPGLVLQRLPLGRDVSLRDLYVRPKGDSAFPVHCRMEGVRLVAERSTTLSFDTYFGAFFEQAWRGPTTLRSVVLRLKASGSFALRILRRSAEGEEMVLHEETATEFDGWLSVPLRAPLIPAAGGRLFPEITALRSRCRIEAMEWCTPDTPSCTSVGLVPVFCTFGREQQLGAVLASLAAEPSCWRDLPAIVVVNQGRPGLAGCPAFRTLPADFAARLTIIEQGNFGGAGGFTRGLLAARELPGATHALLMDDDVAAEPEALRRTAAFFAIARPRQVLGGHMLDMLRPTRLYEAGANVDPHGLFLRPLRFDLPLRERATLDALTRPEPMHYNGWWFFALPLALLDEAGLPLPCFIRGDDVEYGLRLHAIGAPIVALPGVAIWHEPFYVKLNGWQLYYETRNMLVAAANHMPRSAASLAVLLLKRLLFYLLTYRYYSAALLLRAIEDYLRGPALFEADPWTTHAGLDEIRTAYPPEELDRDRVVPQGQLRPDPRTLAGFVVMLAWAMLRNLVVPSRPTAPLRIEARDLLWFRVIGLDHVVADSPWDVRPPAFRRSRATFRRLLAQGARVLLRVVREGDQVASAWTGARPKLTDAAFWMRYLGGRDAEGRQSSAVGGG
jgi:galactofuranosylgalactofuranosylrhamnosyl-N-acetylglucosaminyl-diphospho-decaprenol beta-1,5/1,6-galactofuranosyltransferase